MPIYEYVCRSCRHAFESLVRNGESPACPACGKTELNKQWSVPAAHVASSAGGMPACPAKQEGLCGMSGCSGGGCGMF